MKLKYHRNLTVDRWEKFPFFKQVLMIATEMNRAGKWVKAEDFSEVKRCYERALELLYLTVETLEGARKLDYIKIGNFSKAVSQALNQAEKRSEELKREIGSLEFQK